MEFYGLPGCGKSTVSHAVARLLREDGYSVQEPSFGIDHQPNYIKRPRKLAIACWWYLFHHNEYCSIRSVVLQNGYDGLEALTQTANVIQKIKAYNQKGNAQITIWDQGLIQAAVSLSVKGKVTAGENYRRLLPFVKREPRIVPVYMPVTIDVALKRMNDRHTNDSRVEKLKLGEQKTAMLRRLQDGIDSTMVFFDNIPIVIEDISDLNEKVSVTYQEVVKRTLNPMA